MFIEYYLQFQSSIRHLGMYSQCTMEGYDITDYCFLCGAHNFKLFPSLEKTKFGHLYILTIYTGTFAAVNDKIHLK